MNTAQLNAHGFAALATNLTDEQVEAAKSEQSFARATGQYRDMSQLGEIAYQLTERFPGGWHKSTMKKVLRAMSKGDSAQRYLATAIFD